MAKAGQKYERNKKFCMSYRSTSRGEKSQAKRVLKHAKKFPNDDNAIAALKDLASYLSGEDRTVALDIVELRRRLIKRALKVSSDCKPAPKKVMPQKQQHHFQTAEGEKVGVPATHQRALMHAINVRHSDKSDPFTFSRVYSHMRSGIHSDRDFPIMPQPAIEPLGSRPVRRA